MRKGALHRRRLGGPGRGEGATREPCALLSQISSVVTEKQSSTALVGCELTARSSRLLRSVFHLSGFDITMVKESSM